MEERNSLPRRRKSNRVSIMGAKREGDDDEGSSPNKSSDQDVTRKKSRSSRPSRVSGTKGTWKPVQKKKEPTDIIEFSPRDSELLENRIKKSSLSWFSKAWRLLTEGLTEPVGITPEETYVYHMRSFLMYLLHVILVFWVIYGTFDLEYNYQSIIMSDLITLSYFESNFLHSNQPSVINFNDIRSPQSIWDFIRSVILKVLYPIETYNNTNSILQDSVMIGVAQLRQVRVKKDTCQTAPLFEDLYKSCYGYISEGSDAEDKEPFGLNSSRPWKYSINLDKKITGRFDYFTGSGYALNFSKDYNWTVDQLTELEDNQWIRIGTRAVFLDFSTFCQNTNTFLIAKLTFEMMPWGGVYPTSKIYSVKLLTSLNDANAFLLLGVDAVLLGYTIGLTYILFLRLRRMGMETLFTFNNIIDSAIISSTYATLGIHVALAYYTHHKLESIVDKFHTSEHPTFGIFINTYDLYLVTAAALALCMTVKFIRYGLYFNETFKLSICALCKVKEELLWFTIMNLIVLFAFGFIYCTVYGSVHPQMTTPLKCMLTLIYNHARSYKLYMDSVTGNMLPPPIKLFSIFTIPLAVIYINCISHPTYMALMVHGWELAVRDCAKDPLRILGYEMYFIRTVHVLERLKLFKYANKLQEYYIIQMNGDDYYPITEIMRRYGWTNLEIRLLLRKYGIRKGDDLSIEELFDVYQDFWMRNALFLEVTSHEQLKNDLELIQRMSKYTESTIADLKISVERLADQFLEKNAKQSPVSTEPTRSHDRSPSRKSILSRLWHS